MPFTKFRGLITSILLCVPPLIAHAQIPALEKDLITFVSDVADDMPASGSNGFTVPTIAELDNFQELMAFLVNLEITEADSLIQVDFPFYKLSFLTDTGFENRQYYVLHESAPITQGWGTYIVNPAFERQIAVEVPHALFDSQTHIEGVDVFRRTGSRYFMMSGVHRCANDQQSGCSGSTSVCSTSSQPYPISDMAHYDLTMFQGVHETIVSLNPLTYVINLHGHARSSCEDFFLTNGHASLSQPLLFMIRDSLIASGDVSAAVAGDGSSCPLIGSTNVQGRYSNGSQNPCTQAVSSVSGYFIHIEQSFRVRSNASLYNKLTTAINEVIQPITDIRLPQMQQVPRQFQVLKSYPNPFNPSVTIVLDLPEPDRVKLKIYDALGRQVADLINAYLNRGEHKFQFQPRANASGVYYVQFQGHSAIQTMQIHLVR